MVFPITPCDDGYIFIMIDGSRVKLSLENANQLSLDIFRYCSTVAVETIEETIRRLRGTDKC